MKLTKTQQLGLITTLMGFTVEGDVKDALTITGKNVAASWMNLSDEEKVTFAEEAYKGLMTVNKVYTDLDSEFKYE